MVIVSLLFLPWYSLTHSSTRGPSSPGSTWICGTNDYSCTGFETFPSCAGSCRRRPVAVDPRLDHRPWPQALLGPRRVDDGGRASRLIVLIGYNGIIEKPGGGTFGVGLDYGYWLALLGIDRDRGHGLPALAGRPEAGAQGPRHRLSGRRNSVEGEASGVISHDVRSGTRPDRNLALELVRVTEAAALAAARWVGRGEKESADQAAVDAMRLMLDTVPMDGVVVIGEGEKDEAPMLYNGERIGDGSPPEVDIAVDPLEGTRLTARGSPAALAVIALSERGTMFDPGPCVYMEKLAGGPEIADCLSLDEPLAEVIGRVAERRASSRATSP